jgi:hypothetical protein
VKNNLKNKDSYSYFSNEWLIKDYEKIIREARFAEENGSEIQVLESEEFKENLQQSDKKEIRYIIEVGTHSYEYEDEKKRNKDSYVLQEKINEETDRGGADAPF